jgi:MFS family permease
VRRYLAGAVLVRLADEGSRVVLVLLALQRTGSATIGGFLVAAFVFPHVLAAPWAGLLIDRATHPHRLLASAAFCFAAALALTASLIGHVAIVAVFVILVIGGCCGPVITGSVTSQLPALVDPARLPRAFALDALSYNVAGILGPTIGAIIAGAFSPAAALFSLVGCAALGGVVQATLPLGGRIIHPPGGGAHLATIAKVFRQRVLGLVTAASSMGQVGASSLPVFAAILATRHHHSAAAGYLMAAYAAGGLTGALGWAFRPASARVSPYVVMVALIASGVPLAIAAGVHQLATTAVFFAISGVFIGPMLGALFTSRQDEAPPHLRAQVFAVGAGVKTTAGACGAALAGLLSHLATSRQLLVAASWPLVAGCLGLAALLLPHAVSKQATEETFDGSLTQDSARS